MKGEEGLGGRYMLSEPDVNFYSSGLIVRCSCELCHTSQQAIVNGRDNA